MNTRMFGFRPPVQRTPSRALTLLTGIGLGATAAYLLDPERGRRRRVGARDRATHLVHEGQSFLGKAMRDARNRATGTIARITRGSDEPSDLLLCERARAVLGHHVSHAHAIDVSVRDGVVTLHGPIIREEIAGLVRAVRRIPGVGAVRNALEPHDREENIPSLQGGASRNPARGWTPAARLVVAGGGVVIGLAGRMAGGVVGLAATLGGGALLVRAMTGRPLREALGLEEHGAGVTVRKSVTVDAPVGAVYSVWADPRRLPHFLGHVEEITPLPEEYRSQWRVRGPGGVPIQWIVEIVDAAPDECITWRTVSGPIAHTSTVQFEQVDENTTRVHVRMSYRPPAGSLGHALASLMGQDPKHALTEDLQRMKSMLEREYSAAREAKREAIGEPTQPT